MMPVVFPVRWRCAVTRGAASAGSTDPADAQTQQTVAAQHAAFDADTAEHAEMLRELDALESLMLEQLKNEDEIMKKWIALV
jgi:hypothetical protein